MRKNKNVCIVTTVACACELVTATMCCKGFQQFTFPSHDDVQCNSEVIATTCTMLKFPCLLYTTSICTVTDYVSLYLQSFLVNTCLMAFLIFFYFYQGYIGMPASMGKFVCSIVVVYQIQCFLYLILTNFRVYLISRK